MDSNVNDIETATASLAIAPNDAAHSTDSQSSPPSTAEIAQPVPTEIEDPFAVITNNKPGFRYKYPQASPTPPDEDDVVWNKVYTAADSRMYNKHHKNANESRKYRESGETRTLAIRMLAENREKHVLALAAAKAAGLPFSPKTSRISTTPAAMAPKKKDATIKKEASSSSRDGTPGGDAIPMSISEKIKSEGRARKVPPAAPSSNQGTPAPSTAPKQGTPSASAFTKQGTPSSGPKMNSPAPEKASSVPPQKIQKPVKKGTATTVKKQHAKKAKPDAEKAGTPSSNRASQAPSATNAVASDSESNDGGEYCICRGPDDHRMMVYCDGGCEDWYHCSCVGINEDDAKELLDRFICPKCKTDTLFTTWKRMCRCNNVPTIQCRRAARVTSEPPSKYCSDEHATAFWEFVASKVRKDDAPSIGGALNFNEVGNLLAACKTADDFHKLGQKPRLPKREDAEPNRPVGLDYVNEDEQKQIDELKQRKKIIEDRIKGFQNQQKLLIMINDRSKIAAKEPNLEVKDMCGYDNRLAMNEAEFDEWFNSGEGKKAFETGRLGPRTTETKNIGAHIPYPGQVVPAPPKVSDALNNICLRPKKKCKHLGWLQIHGQDFVTMQQILKAELKKLVEAEDEIIEDAETREATKEYYADNETIQLF